jgi:hypothetical protein
MNDDLLPILVEVKEPICYTLDDAKPMGPTDGRIILVIQVSIKTTVWHIVIYQQPTHHMVILLQAYKLFHIKKN